MGEYEAYLDRAYEKLPDVITTDERFVIPEPRIFSEGKATVLENFGQIADVLNRDPDHLMKALTRELGTAGKIDGQHAVFQGKFMADAISEQINSYVEEYVKCSECGRPDTKLVKAERVLMLQCDACGAAKVDKYIVYVAGASKKEIVRAKVKRISGTVVFAEPVR